MHKTPAREQHKKEGATASELLSGNEFHVWLTHHKACLRSSLGKFVLEPASNLMTCLVIGIALALPASLFLAIENIKAIADRWDGHPQISLYLHQNISSVAALALQKRLELISSIKTVKYISPEAALEEFKQQPDFSVALQLLDENPLPPVYIITPLSEAAEDINVLARRLQAMPEVEFVQLDLQWVQKLQQIVVLAERLVWLLGGVLSTGVLLMIGNSIRLTIENRREEIVVVKLIGATDAYVRRPLLYSGLWLGLVGGGIACLLVIMGTYVLKAPLLELTKLYGSDYLPLAPGPGFIAGMLFIGVSLGVFGAWLVAERQLDKIGPR